MLDDATQAVVRRLTYTTRVTPRCRRRVLLRHSLDCQVQCSQRRRGLAERLHHLFLLTRTVWIGIRANRAVHRRASGGVRELTERRDFQRDFQNGFLRPNEFRRRALATAQARQLPPQPRHELIVACPLCIPGVAIRRRLAEVHADGEDLLFESLVVRLESAGDFL